MKNVFILAGLFVVTGVIFLVLSHGYGIIILGTKLGEVPEFKYGEQWGFVLLAAIIVYGMLRKLKIKLFD